ncbi:hypothetical protein PCANC_12504 [Puccinia coronata f. sp. avenae]|uniref:Uncharacterized protein n=1 Tax=Puccinia coronata f. sp. avenae TaxID=200324 RepID=A0A2N5SYM8_9BASI|nr:hypothetical protein PCASD_18511 [Puccinia coronata f. sp. avenae]PLW38488.1 hypothetical protein PCANC_12504 [Puccinia coronata f. sp. avenae]
MDVTNQNNRSKISGSDNDQDKSQNQDHQSVADRVQPSKLIARISKTNDKLPEKLQATQAR